MSNFRVVSPTNDAVTSLERNNRVLAARVAEEGIVLMENNGVLPLDKDEPVALFGTAARKTVFGGSGSGDTDCRHSVTIEEGLLQEGFHVESTRWLDAFDRRYNEEKKAWKTSVEEKIKGYHLWNVMAMFNIIYANPFSFPVGQEITEADMGNEATTAIYCIGRQAGEGGDRTDVPGDYQLSETEKKSIEILKAHYRHLVVVINAGASVDLSFMEEHPADALLYMGQTGEESGSALAGILSGRVTPSGHLAATWPRAYTDWPAAENFGDMAPDPKNIAYQEDIYVGYRYFVTAHVSPRYPFGHGLSYTTFSERMSDFRIENGSLVLRVEVTNIGKTEGKHVVQMYVSKPADRLPQAAAELAGFTKSSLLEPGQQEILQVQCPLAYVSSFDVERSEYLLLQGTYIFSLGSDCTHLNSVFLLKIQQDLSLQVVSHIPDCPVFHTYDAHPAYRLDVAEGEIPVYVLQPEELAPSGMKNQTESPETPLSYRKQAASITECLSDRNLALLLTGAPYSSHDYNITPGAVGRTTNALYKKYDIENINMADGPAGLRLQPVQVVTHRGTQLSYKELPEDWQWGFLKKMKWLACADERRGTVVYQYCTAWPSTTVRTQTWDRELIKQVGEAIAGEMKQTGVTLWLGPAVNLQRNPLCGRNFEYASEDPLLSGEMGASMVRGVQSLAGTGAVVKHFACNNQETQREYSSSNVSERALRELYLRSFEIVVKTAAPWAVMGSYNKVNGIYSNNNGALLNQVLREEWDFQGFVMTDWGAVTKKKGSFSACMKNGCDLIMPGYEKEAAEVQKAMKEGTISHADAVRAATRILAVVLCGQRYIGRGESSRNEF